jgi:hypothetical protein
VFGSDSLAFISFLMCEFKIIAVFTMVVDPDQIRILRLGGSGSKGKVKKKIVSFSNFLLICLQLKKRTINYLRLLI